MSQRMLHVCPMWRSMVPTQLVHQHNKVAEQSRSDKTGVKETSVEVCVCVFLYIGCQTAHSTSEARTVLGSEGILAGPHNFKGQFEG